MGMLVEWTQLEVTRWRSLTYEFCGTSESPLNSIGSQVVGRYGGTFY